MRSSIFKTTRQAIALQVFCAALVWLLVWPGRAGDGPAAGPRVRFVTMTIDYNDGVEKRFKAIPWQSGMTILEALAFAEKHSRGIKIRVRGTGATAFLTTIDELENQGRRGGNWTYRVNGRLGERSFALQPLAPGDTILWKFSEYR